MPLRRHLANPILTRDHVPPRPPRILDPSAVAGAGAVRSDDGVRLLLTVETRGRETHLVPARSPDGVVFDVAEEPARVVGLDRISEPVFHLRDPRVTRVGDDLLVIAIADTDGGGRIAVLRASPELDRLVLVSFAAGDGAVLLPGRVAGRYLRIEGGGREGGEELRLAESDDLLSWRSTGRVMAGRAWRFDERVGPGAPPLRTREGWLLLYHGVAAGIGQAGAALLDLRDPTRVLARTRENLLEPREQWETTGRRPNEVIPTAAVALDEDAEGYARLDSRLLVYYSAAGTTVGLAETTVMEVIDACRPG